MVFPQLFTIVSGIFTTGQTIIYFYILIYKYQFKADTYMLLFVIIKAQQLFSNRPVHLFLQKTKKKTSQRWRCKYICPS